MLSNMTLMEALLIIITILLSYFIVVIILKKMGILEKYNISLYGPALLLRTKRGINFLKRIATKKRFWRAYSSTGIVFCYISMIIFVIFFIWQFLFVIGLSQQQRSEILPSANFYLILPGINPILPIDYLFYIIIAFIVAIVVHEFSHGILTLVGDLKVKSMGLLYFIFPIGAFVEPDEEQMKKTKISKRMRVYAVGPFSNFVTFFICLLLFSFVFMSAVQPGVGLTVYEIYEDSPADELGIKKGAIITEVNGTDITKIDGIVNKLFEFKTIINETKANQTITISYIYNNVAYNEVDLKLTDSYNYNTNVTFKGKGHTGIFSFVNEEGNLGRLQDPFNDPANYFLYFMALPIYGYFEGYNPLVSPFIESYNIAGPLGAIPTNVFWIIVNSLYWVAWLNLMVGIFNILPMVPLDGGFLFNDGIKSIIRKIKKDIPEEKSNKIVGNISLIVSLLILLIIISPILLKYI